MAKTFVEKLKNQKTKFSITLLETEHKGHAEQLAYKFAKQHKRSLLISCSGDGGYHEVINGAMRAQSEGAEPICAVLPAGNANVHHGIVVKRPLVKAIIAGDTTRFDLLKVTIKPRRGKVHGYYSHLCVGIGLTPQFVNEVNQVSSNILKEIWIFYKTLFSYRPARIQTNKGVKTYASLVFANIGQIGKVFKIKESRHDDGLFEVVSAPHMSRIDMIKHVVRLSVQGCKVLEQRKSYTFTTLENMSMQMDGEVIDIKKDTEVIIESKKGLLTTLI